MSYWEEKCRESEEPDKVIEELRAEVARLTAELTEAREAMRLATLALGGEPVAAKSEPSTLRMNIDPEWLLAMAEKEDGGIISVGGLVSAIRKGGPEPVRASNTRPVHIRADGQVCEMTGEPIVMPGLEPEHILAAMEDVKAGRLKSLAQIVAERNAKFEPPKHATSIVESFEALRKAGGNAWDRVAHVGEYLGRKGDPATTETPKLSPSIEERKTKVWLWGVDRDGEPVLMTGCDAPPGFETFDALCRDSDDPEPPRHTPSRIVVTLSNLLEHAQGAFDEVGTLSGHCIRHSKTEGFQAAIEAARKALRLTEPAVE